MKLSSCLYIHNNILHAWVSHINFTWSCRRMGGFDASKHLFGWCLHSASIINAIITDITIIRSSVTSYSQIDGTFSASRSESTLIRISYICWSPAPAGTCSMCLCWLCNIRPWSGSISMFCDCIYYWLWRWRHSAETQLFAAAARTKHSNTYRMR